EVELGRACAGPRPVEHDESVTDEPDVVRACVEVERDERWLRANEVALGFAQGRERYVEPFLGLDAAPTRDGRRARQLPGLAGVPPEHPEAPMPCPREPSWQRLPERACVEARVRAARAPSLVRRPRWDRRGTEVLHEQHIPALATERAQLLRHPATDERRKVPVPPRLLRDRKDHLAVRG